ncbi:MAG: fatty acid desaturase [Kofleriaceae bacterium]
MDHVERTLPHPLADASSSTSRFDWPVLAILVVVHLAAMSAFLVAPTAPALALLIGGFFLAGFGIVIGYHRFLSHRAFECGIWQTRVWATLGTLALQGGPVFWAGLHRRHHQFSDQEGDPHSPRNSLLEGHMLWMARVETKGGAILGALNARDLRAIGKDPYMRWLDRGIGPLMPWAVSMVICGLVAGLPGVVWGGFVRTLCGWHATWLVNSVGHRWGRRPHPTNDSSRNVWWLSPIAFGDQWHNNHHANPRAAVLTEKWWQFDPSGWIILALGKLGLARNIRRPTNRYAERAAAGARSEIHD